MKVCNYLELENIFDMSGIGTAVRNQRKALQKLGVETTKNPRKHFDIFHTNTIGPCSLYYIKKCNLNSKKVVLHAHTTAEDFKGSFKFSNKLSKPLKKYLKYFYDQGDTLICPSKYTKKRLKQYGLKKEPKVVSNGIDTDKFKPSKKLRKRFRKKLNLKNEVIFAVGSVFQRKGVKTFIEVAKEFPDHPFVWFGPQYDKLLKKETKKAINSSPSNVIFTGKVENIIRAYSAGDIFFFPSRNENQGIVVLEAASCGNPIVINDIPAFNYLKHRKDCLKGSNKTQFVNYLSKLLNNSEMKHELSENAQETAEEHSLDKIGEKLKKIYEGLL